MIKSDAKDHQQCQVEAAEGGGVLVATVDQPEEEPSVVTAVSSRGCGSCGSRSNSQRSSAPAWQSVWWLPSDCWKPAEKPTSAAGHETDHQAGADDLWLKAVVLCCLYRLDSQGLWKKRQQRCQNGGDNAVRALPIFEDGFRSSKWGLQLPENDGQGHQRPCLRFLLPG